jgi:inorganic pyrophosphatase
MEVKPIGVFHMADDKGQMKSNLCTGIRSNMEFIKNLSDINPHLLKEIISFKCTNLENKQVDVEGWGDVNEAYASKVCDVF